LQWFHVEQDVRSPSKFNPTERMLQVGNGKVVNAKRVQQKVVGNKWKEYEREVKDANGSEHKIQPIMGWTQ
jgi:hypothetical protein